MISGDSIHFLGLTATPDVAGADDDAQLRAGCSNIGQDVRHTHDHILIKQLAAFAQGFAAELQNDALVSKSHNKYLRLESDRMV